MGRAAVEVHAGEIEKLAPVVIDGVRRVAAAIFEAKQRIGLETIRREAKPKGDGSPVTGLDHLAHRLLIDEIATWPEPYSSIAIVSEEDEVLRTPEDVCREESLFWLMDPLDGTRDLLAGEATYAMVIALMAVRAGAVRPLFGVIAAPEFEGGTTWGGGASTGLHVHRNGKTHLSGVVTREPIGDPVRVLGSRSIPSEKMKQLYELFGTPSIERLGSAIKFGLIAEGRFDVYPRLGPTSEWDTAAGQALLETTGGALWSLEHKDVMTYGKHRWENSGFLAVGLAEGELSPFSAPLDALHREYLERKRGRR